MINEVYEYTQEGFRIFPLWSFEGTKCSCPNENCNQAGKHPSISSWTKVPVWSDEQLEAMLEHSIKTGFGVVVENHLIVDVDPRNGGRDGLAALIADLGIDLVGECGYHVITGGNGKHLYFRLPEGDATSYVQALPKYRGIDFKTSGFVVGTGSKHASGGVYRTDDFLHEITQAPQKLLDLLKRPETYRSSYQGEVMDFSEKQIKEILGYVNPDCEYEQWIRCGMAIHEATNGAGFDMWDEWSQCGDKYSGTEDMQVHWQSFGKSTNPVTLGTLVHYAEENGYQLPVTFTPEEDFTTTEGGLPFSIDHIDLLRPPGFTGKLTQWINSQCRYPRERLAVVSALTSLGNVCGMKYTDDKDGITMNLMSLCVAGSATGKEAILQSAVEIHKAVMLNPAIVGQIKSEQEIVRNLVRHQAAFYLVDEVGYLLQKIESARKHGGASYLDGVIATLMAVFSKADGSFLVGGDLKDSIKSELKKELAQCRSKIENMEDESGYNQARAETIENHTLKEIEVGLKNPYMSLMGMTTPVSFDGLVSVEQSTNGFIGRCLLVREHETNPKRKRGFRKPKKELPDELANVLRNLFDMGDFNAAECQRIEYNEERKIIPSEQKAIDLMEDAADWLEEQAELHKGKTGLEAIVRRSYELMAKVSLILAAPEGYRTVEHVKWAFALMKQDMETKISLAQTNIMEGTDEALKERILDAVGDGELRGTILQRVTRTKKYNRDVTEKMLDQLVQENLLHKEEEAHPVNGRLVERFVRTC